MYEILRTRSFLPERKELTSFNIRNVSSGNHGHQAYWCCCILTLCWRRIIFNLRSGGTQTRKRIIPSVERDIPRPDEEWLDLERVAEVEITSEDAAHPIESALLGAKSSGWRAAGPGEQIIRLLFAHPQRLRRIWLEFVEPEIERTQEFVLRWSQDGGQSFREIVRQQWNFSPHGATRETEDHRVDLSEVTVLELKIIPDISGGNARASLAQLRLA